MRIALWRAGVDPEQELDALAKTIAKRECIDFNRKLLHVNRATGKVPFCLRFGLMEGERLGRDEMGGIRAVLPYADLFLAPPLILEVSFADLLAELERLTLNLTSRERAAVLGRAHGKTLKAIGIEMGISESRACQLLTSAKRKMRRR